MSKKSKYRCPKFFEGIEEPELLDWEEDSDDSEMCFDTEEQRCFPFPAVVLTKGLAAANCNPRYCQPNCNPRYCRPRCNPQYYSVCNPYYCNPGMCNPNACRPRPAACRPAGYCRPAY